MFYWSRVLDSPMLYILDHSSMFPFDLLESCSSSLVLLDSFYWNKVTDVH